MNRSLLLAVSFAALVLCGCPRKPGAADAGSQTPSASVAPSPAALISDIERHLQAGDVDAALAKARALVDAPPQRALHQNLLGRVLIQRYERTHDAKDAQAAVDALETAIKLDPRFAPAHENLAKLADRRGLLTDAAAHYEALLTLDPGHPARARLEALRKAQSKK